MPEPNRIVPAADLIDPFLRRAAESFREVHGVYPWELSPPPEKTREDR